jgi:hypothetical protein
MLSSEDSPVDYFVSSSLILKFVPLNPFDTFVGQYSTILPKKRQALTYFFTLNFLQETSNKARLSK